MTIGLEEAQRRNVSSSSYCEKRAHKECHGYYVIRVMEWGRELGFCECTCHD